MIRWFLRACFCCIDNNGWLCLLFHARDINWVYELWTSIKRAYFCYGKSFEINFVVVFLRKSLHVLFEYVDMIKAWRTMTFGVRLKKHASIVQYQADLNRISARIHSIPTITTRNPSTRMSSIWFKTFIMTHDEILSTLYSQHLSMLINEVSPYFVSWFYNVNY